MVKVRGKVLLLVWAVFICLMIVGAIVVPGSAPWWQSFAWDAAAGVVAALVGQAVTRARKI